MVHVFGHHDQVMLQRCGGYEDISITAELALLVEHGIEPTFRTEALILVNFYR